LYIASSKDGTVKIFDATSFELLKTVAYGDDADNLRYDSSRERIYVGYGSGGLGELNAEGQKVAEIKLGPHPESFQLEKSSPRNYVNLPKPRKIGIVDREGGPVTGSWRTGLSLANYAMALDPKRTIGCLWSHDFRLAASHRYREAGKPVQTLRLSAMRRRLL
jgi:hypothetical protein